MSHNLNNHKLRIAAVGDLHVQEHSFQPYHELFNRVSDEADIVLLCGDLTNTGLPKEAENLAASISQCKVPVLGVLGNHDHHSDQLPELRKILSSAKLKFLDDETFIMNGVGFAGVKGFGGGFDNHMLGFFGEKATKEFVTEAVNEALRLENALKQLETEKKVVALHYSPIMDTVSGEPEAIYTYLGCSRFAEVIDRFDVSAVFHGHAHHGTMEGKTHKGAAVYNVSLDLLRQKDQNLKYLVVEV